MPRIKFLDGSKGKIQFKNNWSDIKINKVKKSKNPNWTRDELIISLNFYHSHFPKIPDKKSKEIKELSQALQDLAKILDTKVGKNYRNENGVFMKMMNFHSCNKSYQGEGLKSASKLDKKIFDDFTDKKELKLIAENILSTIKTNTFNLNSQNEDIDFSYEGREGKVLSKIHQFRERDKKIVELKKITALKDKGKLSCEICNFDFTKKYGLHGDGYIECHHLTPLSQMKINQKTRLNDLSLLCSNCHKMIHRKSPWLTIEQLKKILR